MASIRKATPSDLPSLNRISFAAKQHWQYPAEWMEKWRVDLTLTEKDFSEQLIFALEEDTGEILGFCAVKENEQAYEITHLWLAPAFIGNGLGKFLLRESLLRAATKAKPVLVEADPNAESFYEKQGFITIGRVESYPKGRFLPLMKKEQTFSY